LSRDQLPLTTHEFGAASESTAADLETRRHTKTRTP